MCSSKAVIYYNWNKKLKKGKAIVMLSQKIFPKTCVTPES